MTTTKVCTACKRELPLTAFHRRRHYVQTTVRAECRESTATRTAAWRAHRGPLDDESRRRERVRARTRRALASGRLSREPCAVCRAPGVEPHHRRYDGDDAHLDVEWLCKEHHELAHGHRDWTRQMSLGLAARQANAEVDADEGNESRGSKIVDG